MDNRDYLITQHEPVLVTGANGFVGTRVVKTLLEYGFTRIRCFVRPTSRLHSLNLVLQEHKNADVEIVKGNLLSQDDCVTAVKESAVVYHLAAGVDKSFPGAYLNSVVTTRNVLEAVRNTQSIKRFVNISSFAVYSNISLPPHSLLDETCAVDDKVESRHEAYVYGKHKQDELVRDYHRNFSIPHVIVRPGVVFGPGKKFIPSRVGIATFGIFLHIGGDIQLPLTYVDNCAEAIVLAGLRQGIEGEVFNIIDDNLPTSREFLRSYKKHVNRFASLYIPYKLFYVLCSLWEYYAKWSKEQLPPVFNRRMCSIYWKGNVYTNAKAKIMLGWVPKVDFSEALKRYYAYQKEGGR